MLDVTPRGLVSTEQTTEVTFHSTVFVVTSHVYLTKFITLLGFGTSQAIIVETLSLPTQFASSSKTGILRLKKGLADTLGYRETLTSEWPAIRLSSSLQDLPSACWSLALDNKLKADSHIACRAHAVPMPRLCPARIVPCPS